MNITDIRVRLVKDSGKLRGIASITFDDEFAVHDIKVIEGDRGMFVAMPSRKTPDGEFRDIAHPISQKARDQIQEMVIAAYEKATCTTESE